VIIGEISSLTATALKTVRDKNKVRFTGKIKGAGNYIKYFNVYVQPATEEGFGNAIIEAMLSKTPIIAAKAGALPELIINNFNGILFEPLSPEDLSEKIKMLIIDRTMRHKLIKNSIDSANQYTPLIFAKNFMQIIGTYQ